jgi:hypothetical protein
MEMLGHQPDVSKNSVSVVKWRMAVTVPSWQKPFSKAADGRN